ncbi:alpha-galactosidase [Sphingobacteriales bacterium UPWRP_1]|nr:alpha-galactosidase [Sphingobacteriales bacterium UPWRP_1]
MLLLQQAILHISYLCQEKKIDLQIPLEKIEHQPIPGITLSVAITKPETQARQLQLHIHATQTVQLEMVKLRMPVNFLPNDRFFCNGFQSWSFTDEFTAKNRLMPVKWFAKPLANAFGDYSFYNYPQKKGHLHGWTYGYVKHAPQQQENPQLLTFLGSLNEQYAYTVMEFETCTENKSIAVGADCSGLLINPGNTFSALNLLLAHDTEDRVFSLYFSLLEPKARKYSNLPPTHRPNHNGMAGWTSWYNYYTNISQSIVLENLCHFQEQQIPISVFQIDDGWQQAVGDWTKVNSKFPQGLAYLSRQIQASGYLAGLWLAPFICQKQSEIYRKHRHLLLYNAAGKPVTAGYNTMWKSYMYPLNFYHPQVQDYLKEVFDTLLNQWNFDLLKLDFLYAVALFPPEGKTRGEVMYDAMQWLRQVVGNKLILGCGVPLGAAFGHADFCRIGPDVHLSWEMPLLKWLGSREGVSTFGAIKNTIHRRQLNGRAFYNDPDVSILRHQNNQLTAGQRHTLFFINQLFGSLQFVSDNIGQYDSQTLQLYLSQFPLRQKHIHTVYEQNNVYSIYFTIYNLHYLAFSNLSGSRVVVNLPQESQLLPHGLGNYFYHNLLQNIVPANTPLTLQPFQTVCLLAVNTGYNGALAGGNAHLFPCADMVNLQTDETQVTFEPRKVHKLPASVWLFGKHAGLRLLGKNPIAIQQIPEGYLLKYEV